MLIAVAFSPLIFRVPPQTKDFGTAFVDSGTTFTLLPAPAYKKIQAFLQKHYCHLPLVCPKKGKAHSTMFDGYCMVSRTLPQGYPSMRWSVSTLAVVPVPLPLGIA